jgi:peptidoglycan/xylan/chitin deacetylase (PgdA/CDA1 family)
MRIILLLALSYLYVLSNAHVFIYHRFGDVKHPSANTSLEELRKEFNYFKDNGYEVVPLKKIIQKVQNNEKVPNHWVALTIDDAYKSFYTNALPIFKEFNYPFSLYVYVEATNKNYPDFMTWDEIKEASKYGDIGLHSYAHPHLTKLSANEVYEDTKKSMDIFETKMGFKPKTYAYPYGEYNEQVKEEIKKFTFDAILNQNSGSVNQKSDLNNINRIALVGNVNIKQKLRYNSLQASWYEPQAFPQDGVLKRIHAKVDPSIKQIKLYVTGDTWRDISVHNGVIDETVNINLTHQRTRVILSTDYFTVNTNLIIK